MASEEGDDPWAKYMRVHKILDWAFSQPGTDADKALTKKYTPSHRGFYPQFFKGIRCAIEGIIMVIKTTDLKERVKAALPMTGAATAVVAVVVALGALWQGGFSSLLEDGSWTVTFLQIANYASLLLVFALDKKLKQDDELFFESVKIDNKAFSDKLVATKKIKKSLKVKLQEKSRRLVKMLILRFLSTLSKRLLPKQLQFIALPAIRVYVLKPSLGTAMAVAASLADFFPTDALWDEIILIATEIMLDAYDFGLDLIDPYTKRLDNTTATYLKKRYHGYISGMGLIFSLCARVPLLAPTCVVIGEGGAAKLILRLVGVNQMKDPKMTLLGEELVAPIASEVNVTSKPTTSTAKPMTSAAKPAVSTATTTAVPDKKTK